ncbi:hypothetical protein TNCV_2097471 [Trichonephila clavipes]|nr:hypothetical protein TNCV_2097471 [Trichonephila clavipes]
MTYDEKRISFLLIDLKNRIWMALMNEQAIGMTCIKTRKSYKARKLIVPQLSQTYAQAAKSSTLNNFTQTDENITKIKCSPLKLLEPLSPKPSPNISISTPDVSRSSSSTQALWPRRRKPAPEEYTMDEEDMIIYDVEEDEIEPHHDLVEKDWKQYWKGSLLLTPTRSRK